MVSSSGDGAKKEAIKRLQKESKKLASREALTTRLVVRLTQPPSSLCNAYPVGRESGTEPGDLLGPPSPLSQLLEAWTAPKEWQARLPMEMDNGKDVFLIAGTGLGKSTIIYVPLLADIQESKESIGLVIVPTKTLADDQARSANSKGIPSLALHEDTLRVAQDSGKKLFNEVKTGAYRLVFLGPEMLVSPPFDAVIQSPTFRSALRFIFVDEAHLACEWSSFRDAYRRVKLLRSRLGSKVVWAALTATCAQGAEMDALCDSLGFKEGQFILEILPVDRATIKYEPRFFQHSISGYTFLDLCWIVLGATTLEDIPITIVFAERIELVTRIKRYLWQVLPPTTPNRKRAVLAYHSIHSSEYRLAAMAALRDGSTTRVLVSTDTGAYGLDISTIQRVVVVGLSSSYHAMIQRIGRIRTSGVAVCYFPEWMNTSVIRSAKGEKRALQLRSQVPQHAMIDFANATTARCPRRVNCEFWGQPYTPPSGSPCLCSSHSPNEQDLQLVQKYIEDHQDRKIKSRLPMPQSRNNHPALSVSDKSRALAFLVQWRSRVWRTIEHPPLAPASQLVSTPLLEDLTKRLHQCTTYERLKIATQTWKSFDSYGPQLWEACQLFWKIMNTVESETKGTT
ncbi:P-loop containing nucleoside triphosphate hydrolase protein [Ceratobasidium sp. AG-I]|nr:P-loop containing nucleoside triphosphate hydrolase protein [Ceratobasidium sp. AG-I]